MTIGEVHSKDDVGLGTGLMTSPGRVSQTSEYELILSHLNECENALRRIGIHEIRRLRVKGCEWLLCKPVQLKVIAMQVMDIMFRRVVSIGWPQQVEGISVSCVLHIRGIFPRCLSADEWWRNEQSPGSDSWICKISSQGSQKTILLQISAYCFLNWLLLLIVGY